MKTILCINGSDSMGHSGIQADIRTLQDMGCHAATAVTSVTVQNSMGINNIYHLPAELVVGQVKAIYEEKHPDTIKIGMVHDAATQQGIRNEIVGCRHIVCSPVILSSYGGLLMDNDSIQSYCRYLLPICHLLMIKCVDAEIILGQRICTDQDMITAARRLHAMGAAHILIRGGTYSQGRINALLFCPAGQGMPERLSFFSSVNIEGWQRHGVGGTLSTAIAARLALGDDVQKAVSDAHNYMHCQVVYASAKPTSIQPHALYDRFMSQLSGHYTTAHDVTYYARSLSVSTRYLAQITHMVCGRSPKQIIDEYLVREGERLLQTTSLSIQQIAYQLGFSSQIAFAKFFRSKKGCAPSAIRLTHRES